MVCEFYLSMRKVAENRIAEIEQIKNRLYLKILKFRNLRNWNLEDVYEIILKFF